MKSWFLKMNFIGFLDCDCGMKTPCFILAYFGMPATSDGMQMALVFMIRHRSGKS